jgi:hypothetical protein
MSTAEQKFAAALMAKLTGSVLKRVDESTVNPSSSGPANRIDPLTFIKPPQPATHVPNQQQQHIIQHLNAEAERLYPLPESSVPASAPYSIPVPPVDDSQMLLPFDPPKPAAVVANNEVAATLKSIDESIKKLVNILEKKWQKN